MTAAQQIHCVPCLPCFTVYHVYHVFFGYKTEFVSFQNNPKILDPSSKMDLNVWDCLRRVKLIAKLHRTDLIICSHSREGKTLSYSHINTVS